MIKVNDVTIPESAILEEMQYHPAESKRQAMLKAAESLVIGEILRQRASSLGLPVSDSGSQAGQDDFIEKLFDQDVYLPEATEDECRLYFEKNPMRFTTSPLLELRHILLAAAPDDEVQRVDSKTLAETLVHKLRAGENFSDLARQFSACPSKETGGSLGQISTGQTVPEFERQVFTANEGLLPAPVESRYGFHVVFIERKISGNPLPYEQVEARIRQYLNDKVKAKATAQYIQSLIQETQLEGFDFSVSDSPLMQ
ncbi:peptidylprolyl isomerase [Thalassolituus sp. C2-1]|uniref:peptidylprolyl isomerase n=1 Tax=Venatorbacter sp. C2-1 TaxID=2597518 RepID=UPI000C58FC8B|nr:peptidylprolyl isomerase [Thalassolituus sp. C2-1]PIQ41686.1 MAG: peptidylprolyl isomerase [Thalassolituus sp. CG17_big_fil_post_rev_8_21_14_2_50_53_8]TVV44948.1 peptidylprolyl isomerase [Thalassolituus sp. C2-1]